jgi:hypothetical protein
MLTSLLVWGLEHVKHLIFVAQSVQMEEWEKNKNCSWKTSQKETTLQIWA